MHPKMTINVWIGQKGGLIRFWEGGLFKKVVFWRAYGISENHRFCQIFWWLNFFRTANGNVEARVVCFYRRSEVSSSVLQQADKNHWGADAQANNNSASDPNDSDDDDSENEEKSEKSQLKQREVFLSRQTETLPATLIRGKCSVTLLSEVENAQSYLGREDAFFYALVYDPHAKTLVADRGEIRIGTSYQVSAMPW